MIRFNDLLAKVSSGEEAHALRNFNFAAKLKGKPAPLGPLLRAFDIEVEQVRMTKGQNGRIINGAGLFTSSGTIIEVNVERSNKAKRFTVLHELCHHILHRNSADLFETDMNFNVGGDYLAHELVHERQAHQGAASIMFDHGALRAVVSLYSRDLDELSEIFGVNEKVISIGLRDYC